MKVRKQVYELTAADLEKHPIWEFALDEEGEDGQDEATVRPWEGREALDPSDGMFVVRSTFTAAGGKQFVGYLTPPVSGEISVGIIQPIIVAEHGQVMFWCGALPPTAEALRDAYAKLQLEPAAVFPCRYASAVTLLGGAVSGSLNGFMHYRSFNDHTVVEAR